MKILLVTEFFPDEKQPTMLGGVQSRTYSIVKKLGDRHDIEIISLTSGNIQATTTSLFERLQSTIHVTFSHPKVKPDVVEASNITTYIPAFLLAKRLKVPIIAWIPDLIGKDWYGNFSLPVALAGFIMEKIAIKLPFDHIIAMSNATREKILKEGVKQHKISVIYGGVENKEVKSLNVKKFTRPTICTISRLVPYKRISDLILAIPIVARQIPKIRCLIIGEGNEKKKLQNLISKQRLETSVELLGSLTHQKTIETLKRSHVFCLPSSVEGFGLVTIEALAAEVPYVSSQIPPTEEITKGGKGGLLFEVKNPQDLANKIIRLLTNKKLYQQKKEEAGKLAIKYDWDIIAKQTESIYKKIVNEK